MNLVTKNILETGIRVLEFKTEPGVPTTNARATALFTQLGTEVAAMQGHATTQAAGVGVVHSGAVQRREIAKVLRRKFREITDTAKGLDKETYPGAAAQFRMPRSQSYQALLATGNAFLEDVGPIKAGFVECGLPADFDEQLGDVVASFATATGVRDSGLAEQIRGTSGIDAQATVVRGTIGKLRAVLNNLLASNPGLLSAWKSASRIPRSPVREDEEGGSGSGSGSGGGSTPTLAAAAVGIPTVVEPRVNGTSGALLA
jgi:hypothetical protein